MPGEQEYKNLLHLHLRPLQNYDENYYPLHC
jgi:hypothetical protein